MHRHHSDFVVRVVDLTLDHQVFGLHPRQETCQVGDVLLLVLQGLRQQRVDPILGLCPKAGQQVMAAVVVGQDAFDQVKGAEEVRFVSQVLQDCGGRVILTAPAQILVEEAVCAAVMGQCIELLFGPTEERRAQSRRQR